MKGARPSEALQLSGTPFERGKAQSAYAANATVVGAIESRLVQNKAVYEKPPVRDFLKQQWEFARENCPDEIAEMKGVADGFGMDVTRLFQFLHLGVVKNLAMPVIGEDGCSTWAVSDLAEGPVVGKNRDFLGEHAGLQAVFSHRDPSWAQGRRTLCIGSLGAPGAYSSGMNSDGLVVVDTQIATCDHGIGWLRYFLMTRLLTHHGDVASALNFIKSVSHAGGGSLILSDPSGAIAAVDLGHTGISVVAKNCGWVARTNHFSPGSVSNLDDRLPEAGSTSARRQTLENALSSKTKTLVGLANLMATHSSEGAEGLCRHGGNGDGQTLSSAIFLCQCRKIYFCDGYPCDNGWEEFSMG